VRVTTVSKGLDVETHQRRFTDLRAEIAKVLVGQEAMLEQLLTALVAGGHVLLEGVPGLAKTLVIRTLADAVDTGFSRIQFTPDMLPADVLGTEVFQPKEGSYTIKRGPVFSNLVLADEINRAPAKVQAALLEAMQERQVTIGDETFPLDEPFLVLATQNPIEQEGTYPLPEAQLDRFMLKVTMGYPNADEELKVIDRMAGGQPTPVAQKVLTPAHILAARSAASQVFVDDKVKRYVVALVQATRDPRAAGLGDLATLLDNGASPRASIDIVRAAKARALLQGRDYVTPHDVKSLAPAALRHRVALSFEAEARELSSDKVVARILENIEVP
jgi:MoxR-like ATPase